MRTRHGFASVIGSILLIVVTIVVIINYINWSNSFQDKIKSNVESTSNVNINFEYFEPTKIYIRSISTNSDSLSFSNLKIDDIDCGVSGSLSVNNITMISLGNCTQGMSIGIKSIVLYTDKGIYSQKMYLKSELAEDSSVVFNPSNSCDSLGGNYVKIYGLETISNAHAEIASQSNFNYSMCIQYNSYTLGNSCIGNFSRIFYLGDVNNSHIWIDNSTPYLPISTWQEICISSNVGTVTSTLNTSNPNDGSVCLGSILQDDVYGGHIGDCSAHSNKIWLKII